MKHVWKLLLALVAGVILLIVLGGPKDAPPAPAAPPAPPAASTQPADSQPRQTIKKTTQNVLELEQALAQGAKRADLAIKSQGLEIASEAYRTGMGKVSIIAVEQKMNFFKAENDRAPKDYAEFMDRIIGKGKPDGILLPMLPYYQEYAYDPEAKGLVVVEFPARKEQREKDVTGPLGR
jgi:hypothetical protein